MVCGACVCAAVAYALIGLCFQRGFGLASRCPCSVLRSGQKMYGQQQPLGSITLGIPLDRRGPT